MSELEQQINVWINTIKPGPFVSDSASDCWKKAYVSFKTSALIDVVDLEFISIMTEMGFDTRTNPFGKWHLDWA